MAVGTKQVTDGGGSDCGPSGAVRLEKMAVSSAPDSARAGSRLTACCLLPTAICLIVSAVCLVPPGRRARAHADAKAAALLEVGGESKRDAKEPAPEELKIVSYNIRWRGGEDLKQIIRMLKEDPEVGGAQVVGLQEVDRNKKRTGNVNTARQLAEALGMRYAWAAPPSTDGDGEEETGVALLSVFPMSDVSRVLLNNEGPEGRRRVAVGATLHVGRQAVRVYSVHAETRMPVEKKVAHWRTVLDDLQLYPQVTRAVVVGDFNTIKQKDAAAIRKLFEGEGFKTPIADDEMTWRTLFIGLKLDWVWLRGLEALAAGVDRDSDLSDHWPVWVRVRLP